MTIRQEPAPSPVAMVRSGLCVGCGSCVAQADAATARMAFDRYGQLRPVGDRAWLRRGPATFAATCPFSPAAADEDALAAELFPAAPRRHPATGRFRAA